MTRKHLRKVTKVIDGDTLKVNKPVKKILSADNHFEGVKGIVVINPIDI